MIHKDEALPGTPIWWYDQPRTGYGPFLPVIAIVVKQGQSRIGIAVLKADRVTWIPKWVPLARIKPRGDDSERAISEAYFEVEF